MSRSRGTYLEWFMAGMMIIVAIFMLLFQPGWKPSLEQFTLPGSTFHMSGYFWPGSLLMGGAVQIIALFRHSPKLRRLAACLAAMINAVMCLSFVQANYLVVGAPVFLYMSVWQWVMFASLREMAGPQSWKA